MSALVALGISFCLYLVISLTVNLEFGYTGIPNFGKVLFVAGGGLIGGSLSYRLAVYLLGLHSNDILASQYLYSSIINDRMASDPVFAIGIFTFMVVVAALVAAALGFLASFPAIKLREDYLGMLLLASGEFLNIFFQSYYPITGGSQGLDIPDPLAGTVATQGLRDVSVLAVVAVFALGVYLYSERVARSPLGRTLRAVRDNEVASEALGKDNVAIRRKVLVVASAISGIAGALWVLNAPYILPGQTGTFTRTVFTFYPFVIVILGGAANNLGVVVGTLAFTGLTSVISQATTYVIKNGNSLPVDPNRIEPIAIGVLLILMLMWRPQGLVPEKPTTTIPKAGLEQLARDFKESESGTGGAVEGSVSGQKPFDDEP